MNHPTARIVCGVGDHGSPAAVAAAAVAALRYGVPLHLVRVVAYPHLDWGAEGYVAPGTAAAAELLAAAREVALDARPGLEVTEELLDTGWVAGGLAEAGSSGTMLVLEQTTRSALRRFVTGTTADGVALRCTSPILLVPAGWSGAAHHPAVVTVGVQDVVEAARLVAAAVAEAEPRGAEVHVVHAVAPMGGYDVSGQVLEDWAHRAERELEGALDDIATSHPDVKIRIDVVTGSAADAVASAAATAQLLVLGRRHHRRPWGSHLGPVAHRLLLEAPCPVLLPAQPERGEPVASTTGATGAPVESSPAPGPGTGLVVVGVGSDGHDAAVAFAGQEAQRRGSGVRLVHAVPRVDGLVPPEAWQEWVADGRHTLAAAARTMRQVSPDLASITAELFASRPPAEMLAEEAEHAAVLVLQHRRLGALRRLVTHSVTNAVAGRARGQVVAVPDGWTPSPEPGRVVLGVADPTPAADLLATALAEAKRRDVSLVVVHSTWLGGNPTGLALDKTMISDWAIRARSALREATAARPAELADVAVSHVVEHVPPVELLARLLGPEDLAVLEARHHLWELPSHLGPVTRGLLGAAPCPVLLVPTTH